METQLHAKNQKKILNSQGCRTGTNVRTHGRTDESEFIGSFRSLKTSGEPTTFIPKIRNIHSGVWNLQAQNSKIGLKWTKFRYSIPKNLPYQNITRIQSMIFSKRTIRTTFIPEVRKIHCCVWKLQVKNSQNCQFLPKRPNGPNFAISEFSA